VHYRASAQKANAAHDLGRYPSRIAEAAAVWSKPVYPDHRDQRGSKADQRVRAQTCRLALPFTFEPNDCAQQSSDDQQPHITQE
jgi:hypothetical protein